MYDSIIGLCKKSATYILGIIFLYSAVAPIYSNLSSFYHYKLGVVISTIVFPLLMIIVIYVVNKYYVNISALFNKLPDNIKIYQVLIFALLVRLLWILLVDNSGIHPDSLDLKAKDLFDNGKIFALSSEKPMGTPIITAIQYYIFGYNRFSGLILQVVASVSEIYLVFLVLRRTSSLKVGLLAAIVLSIHPESIFFSNLILSDTFYSLSILIIYYLLFFHNNWLVYIVSGSIAAISYYIRPVTALPLLVIFSYVFIISIRNKKIFTFIGKLFLFLMVFLVVMIPQIRFNYQSNNSLSISTSNQLGLSLAFATSPYYFARCNNKDVEVINKMIIENGESIDMSSKDKYGKQLAKKRFIENPFKVIFKSIIIKPFILWGNPGSSTACVGGIKTDNLKTALIGFSLIFNKLLLILSGLTLLKFKILRSNDFVLLLIAYALIVTISQLFLECQPRYSHMFIPLQCMILGLITEFGSREYVKKMRNF